ncbi:MAG: YCF48-related protein, partial [Chloroflexota bacterium]
MMRPRLLILGSLCLCGLPPAATHIQAQSPPGRWESQKSGIGDKLKAVTFVSEKVGCAVGSCNTILGTKDGGKTWRRLVERKKDGPHWGAILFTSAKVGWVRTDDTHNIAQTTDGGESWNEVPLPKPQEWGLGGVKHAAV